MSGWGRTAPLLFVAAAFACGSPPVEDEPAPEWPRAVPAPVSGTLRVSLHGGAGAGAGAAAADDGALRHSAIWVSGPSYAGHADNDLRGFLDGRFRNAWNQAGQIHTRVGRASTRSALGERELFRNLHQWDALGLPEGAAVRRVRLEVDVEEEAGRELDLFLYEVLKDWEPGEGGVERDNNSAPAHGEVWWNEAMHGVRPWGMPGAGFASDEHPEADTPVGALARTRYVPGDSLIAFESAELAAYVEAQARAGEPVRLLLKLSDYLEDTPDTRLHLYSANHGDSRNTARRPRLLMEWEGPRELARLERRIVLEHGRTLTLPGIPAGGTAAVSASFVPDEGYGAPRIEMRGGRGEDASAWVDLSTPRSGEWDWVEVRLDTHVNPVPLGESFEAAVRDTWTPTAPPEEQEVRWVFVSPSGERHERSAEYVGEYEWRIVFAPDEVGRWQYQWSQNFIEEPYESVIGVFDVKGEDRQAVLAALRELIERVRASDLSAGDPRVEAYGEQFLRLQRALLRLETPEGFPLGADPADSEVSRLLDEAREALSGQRPAGSRLDIDLP